MPQVSWHPLSGTHTCTCQPLQCVPDVVFIFMTKVSLECTKDGHSGCVSNAQMVTEKVTAKAEARNSQAQSRSYPLTSFLTVLTDLNFPPCMLKPQGACLAHVIPTWAVLHGAGPTPSHHSNLETQAHSSLGSSQMDLEPSGVDSSLSHFLESLSWGQT